MGFWPVFGPCQRLKLNGIRGNPRVEARVGIGQVWALSAVSNAYPQGLRHQRHPASKLSNIPIVRHFRRYVKPRYYAPTTPPLLSNYSVKTHSLALSLALFRPRSESLFATLAFKSHRRTVTKTLDLDLDKLKARASDRAEWAEGVLLFVIDLRSVHKVNSECLSKHALRNDPNQPAFEL